MATATLNHLKPPRPAARRAARHAALAPLLDNGYRLSQADFHRRYEQMPDLRNAELVEGIVFMGSPVSYSHAQATHALNVWLGTYVLATPGVESADNATVILDADNEFQPDALLRLPESLGGRSRIEGKYVQGAPELVVEVAVTSVALDLNDKLRVYRRNGVPEYLVWQLERNRLDWFRWQDAEYVPQRANARGVLSSTVFPGLWLDSAALLAGDLKKVMACLQRGLASAAHRQFARPLSAR